MSDTIIRLGGSHIGNPSSIHNLQEYLKKSNGRKFVVVSAIPGLLELLNKSILTIFEKEINKDDLEPNIYSFYTNNSNAEISSDYYSLAQQLTSLLNGIALIGDYSTALKDQVLSFAEKLTVEILKSNWENAVVLQPQEIKLLATADYGNATFISVDKEKLIENCHRLKI